MNSKKYQFLKHYLNLDEGEKYPEIMSGGNLRKLSAALNLYLN